MSTRGPLITEAKPVLPIEAVIPAVIHALETENQVLIEAAPGAGKSTVVPLRLLPLDWLYEQKILLLEPRRIAARAIARRMAQILGEPLGETVGYRMRLEKCVSERTRLEVITEGVLTRQLQNDPELKGVGCIIFDEFHERSLQADFGLALALDIQSGLREDLRIILMSATLHTSAIKQVLPHAAVVHSAGKVFPVETFYSGNIQRRELVANCARVTAEAVQRYAGNVLVFLPGKGEIQSLQRELSRIWGDTILIAPLYGGLGSKAQDHAIALPPEGCRKCVLATNIAETSLTIEGISIVVDSGVERRSSFNPRIGVSGLVTVDISDSSADQRRGRAGRLGPGVCYRLWSESARRIPHAEPEILLADLAELQLQLLLWGVKHASDLNWVTLPAAAHMEQAKALLRNLSAINLAGDLTTHGRKMAAMSLHPRMSNMLLQAKDLHCGQLACDIAALLQQRNPFFNANADSDFSIRVRYLQNREASPQKNVIKTILHHSKLLQRQLGVSKDTNPQSVGLLLARAYPDRIAQRRSGSAARYKLSNGQGAVFSDNTVAIAQAPWIVITEMDQREGDAKIFSAASLAYSEIIESLPELLQESNSTFWDNASGSVKAVKQIKIGKLLIAEAELVAPDHELAAKILLQGITEQGINCLPWNDSTNNWLNRIRFISTLPGQAEKWPDFSAAWLRNNMEHWLLPWLQGKTKINQLKTLNLQAILSAAIDWEQQQEIDQLAPVTFKVPSGTAIKIDYSNPAEPILPVKMQEMYSCDSHPSLAQGKFPLLVHLLSPARRPVQITRDIPGFWCGSYAAVMKEMKGRYPKHDWPQDPLNAIPHRGVKRSD